MLTSWNFICFWIGCCFPNGPKSRLKEHYFASCLNGNILVQFLITLRPHSTTPKAGWIKPDWSLNTVFNFFLFGFCSVCFPPGLALFLWLKIKRQDSEWSSDLRHGFSSVCEQFLAMIHTHTRWPLQTSFCLWFNDIPSAMKRLMVWFQNKI